jgi:putative Mg2+ transporter-C (MgtC) family protein
MIESILLSSFLGLFLGLERAIKKKPASFATFSLVSITSCIFSIISYDFVPDMNVDQTRIAAQVVSGMGFVGAGVIFKNRDKIEGITTAVMLWFSCAVGMACGFGQYSLAIYSVIVYYISIVCSILLHILVDVIHEKINSNDSYSKS